MRVTKFIQVMLGSEKPEEPDGEDHRAVVIKGMSNYRVTGIREFGNAVQIQIKKKEKYLNDSR